MHPLNRMVPANLPIADHEDRDSFLRSKPDLANGGFNLRTGNVSEVWSKVNFGEWQEPEGLADDTDVTVLRSLHERAVREYRSMVETLQAVRNDDDPTLNRDGRLKLAARIIGPKLGALAKAAETELAKVGDRLERETRELGDALRVRDAAAAVVHDGIRRFWSEKVDGNLKAFKADDLDTDTLQALASAPGYLSGINDETHARVRNALAKRMEPERVARIDALQTGKQRAVRALAALDDTASRFIDFNRAHQLIERERNRGA